MTAEDQPGPAGVLDPHKQAEKNLRGCFVDVIDDLDLRAEVYQVPDFCSKAEILEAFSEDLPRTVQLLQTACTAEDELSIRRHGHSLEGMGGMVGFAVLSVAGAELCKSARGHIWDRCATLAARLRRWCEIQKWTAPE